MQGMEEDKVEEVLSEDCGGVWLVAGVDMKGKKPQAPRARTCGTSQLVKALLPH